MPLKRSRGKKTSIPILDDEWIANAVRHDALAGLADLGRGKVSLVIFPMKVHPRRPEERILPILFGNPKKVAKVQKIRQALFDREALLHSQVIEKDSRAELMHDAIATAFDNCGKHSFAEWWIKSEKHLKIELENNPLVGQIIIIAGRYAAAPFRS